MENNEEGFSSAFALTVIFSLCVIVLSFAMLVLADEKKINAYKKSIEAQKEAESVIYNIEKSLQKLKESSCDSNEAEVRALISDVIKYDFSVKDVSTGINKNFISEKIIENEAIRQYILMSEEEAFTEYGWINPKFTDISFIEKVLKDYKNKNIFPLVNSMPGLNIHFMSEDFIKAILKYFNIKNADEKVQKIKDNLAPETGLKEIAELLELSESHPVFELIGLKTAFWEIRFETERCNCRAVYAAVPDRENQKKIEKYILAEKEILKKGCLL